MSGGRQALLTSIHDVSPRFERELAALAPLIEEHIPSYRFSMLVVPNYWGESPLTPRSAFAAKLRMWADAGVEMFVHGLFHKDAGSHAGYAAFKARHMTNGEGEFLGLSCAEAASRMAYGQKLIEDICGQPTAGFVAPAWLYGPGARNALAKSEFGIAEDHFEVWRPQTGEVLARGPVITWASRSATRTASSLAFAHFARSALKPLRAVRVAVHPGDVNKQSIIESISKTLQTFTAQRNAQYYSWLLDEANQRDLKTITG